MTTRATIAWLEAGGAEMARVYIHANGYACDDELAQFFAAEQAAIDAGTRDARWHDPSYLAARYVAWVSGSSGVGVGIVPTGQERFRVHYRWAVTCSAFDSRDVLPTVAQVEATPALPKKLVDALGNSWHRVEPDTYVDDDNNLQSLATLRDDEDLAPLIEFADGEW